MKTEDSRGSPLKRHSSIQFQNLIQSQNEKLRIKGTLRKNLKSLNSHTKTYKACRWLFNLKIKSQVLILTVLLISLVIGMFMGINHIQIDIFASLFSNGFNQMLHQQNANFQASVLMKYMSLTQNYFENDQSMLLAINQMYTYSLQSHHSIDLGVECAIPSKSGTYPGYYKLDLFCYVPQTAKNLQTFENSTLNTEFVKFTSLLNQFVLCFGFQSLLQKNNILQINLDNQDQMSSYYPQSSRWKGSYPTERPYCIFQKQQNYSHISRKFYISAYQKFYSNNGPPLYGQTLTLSLLNQTEFHGVISISIKFSVFNSIFQKFPDVNLALVAHDGTLLFQQNQINRYIHQQFIYNQSSTGYNYLDWMKLSAHTDYTKQIIINNTQFTEPIKVNIKKFRDLPNYFIVYNNLTYENQIKAMQVEILHKIEIQYYILELIIYLKYSELQNLSFKKSLECREIEDLQYQIILNKNRQNRLARYLLQNSELIPNFESNTYSDYDAESHYTQSEFVGRSGYLFTFH